MVSPNESVFFIDLVCLDFNGFKFALIVVSFFEKCDDKIFGRNFRDFAGLWTFAKSYIDKKLIKMT